MNLSPVEVFIIEAVRRHVAHGHGEISIQIRPGSVRVQEGVGSLFDLKENALH